MIYGQARECPPNPHRSRNLVYTSLMNETTQMTFTPDQLDQILGYEPDDRRIYFNECEDRWECESGYGDYVKGWLDYSYNLRNKLNLLTPKFVEMFDQLIDYIDEEGC